MSAIVLRNQSIPFHNAVGPRVNNGLMRIVLERFDIQTHIFIF